MDFQQEFEYFNRLERHKNCKNITKYAKIADLVELGPDSVYLGKPKDWSVMVFVCLIYSSFPIVNGSDKWR